MIRKCTLWAHTLTRTEQKKREWSTTNTWLAADNVDDDDNGELYAFVCFSAARSKMKHLKEHIVRV